MNLFQRLPHHGINPVYLRLAHIAYGGELYYQLKSYLPKDIQLQGTILKKKPDAVVSLGDHTPFFSYKNPDSGFSASVFENKEKQQIIIAYRGTERTGMGENHLDYIAWTKDIKTDINLITAKHDQQFEDAYILFKAVQNQNPNSKIILVGHSLGGGLAQLVAARAYSETAGTKKPVRMPAYTYNAPGCRQLMKVYNCNEALDYSFIINYAVMNDWCGMFGENIGITYLISPIRIPKPENSSPMTAFNCSLLSTHEGIFRYNRKENGRLIKKPEDFGQAEGLSLWYYDKNNPLKDMNIMAFIPKVPDIRGKLSENILYTLSKLLETIKQEVSPESLKKARHILEHIL